MKIEKVDRQKPSLAERSSLVSIHQAEQIITKHELYNKLGIDDNYEKAYFLATIAWDMRRKTGHEISFLFNHSQLEVLRRKNFIANWIAQQIDKLKETEDEVLKILDGFRIDLRNTTPSLTYTSPVIDRASNIITAYIIQAQENERPITQVIEQQQLVINNYNHEIAAARQQFLQVSSTT